ncbi:MAG: extracellular solute-binding protein [Kutzneria sp.]|nr:extracellular solute-binding protein [Kutzneria sp.]MBV9844933.1 extracellular solute-binding protein [Kutzneria sp.]
MRTPSPVALSVIGVLAVGLLSACTPGANSAAHRPTDRPAADVRTDVAAMGQVTLTVWDQEVRGGQDKQISTLNQRFHDRYPNVTINRISRSFDDLRNTVKLALTGNEPPDVVQVNNGKQDMGAFVRAGLLTPLDGYAEAYRWTGRFPESVRRLASYPDTGDSLGEGKLYGVQQTGELVGIYYNRAKLAQLGLTPPKTWEELDTALAKAHDAGQLPIQLGNLDKAAGAYLFSFAMHRFEDPATQTALATGRAGASWLTDPNRAAARQVLDWVARGYLTPGFAGLKGDDSWAAFAKGDGVFHIDGTWLMPDLREAMGDSVGFLLPPGRPGGPTVTGGTGLPWAVSGKTRNPDAAAAYLDFITSADAMKVIADNGNLPVVNTTDQSVTGLQRQVFDAWRQASTTPALVPYLDYATQNAYEVVTGSVEQLMSRQLDVDTFLGQLQADLDASHGGR